MVAMDKGKIFNVLEVILKEINKMKMRMLISKKKLNHYYRILRIFIMRAVTIEFMNLIVNQI